MNTKLLRLNDLEHSPLWDTGNRKFLHRWKEHNQIFTNEMAKAKKPKGLKILITTVFDRNYKEAGKTLFNTI